MIKKHFEEEDSKPIAIEVCGRSILISIAVTIIILGGSLLRMIPLVQSPYPYILDGLGEARFAEDILANGDLAYNIDASYAETHTVSTPLFDTFLAASSLILQEEPLFLIQKIIPAFSVMLLLGAFVLSYRFVGSHRVGIYALMALASYGSFVIITQASWKECIGLSLVPIILISFLYRADLRMRILSSMLILMMPFLHHFITLIVMLTMVFATSMDFMLAVRKRSLTSGNLLDLVITIVAIDEAMIYYSVVQFDRLEYLTPQTGLYLFLGLTIVMAIGVYYVSSRRITKVGSRIFTGVTSVLVGLLFAANIISPMGTVGGDTISMLSISLIISFALFVLCIWGISIFSTTMEKSKTLFYAFLSAPANLVIYAILRAQDLISLDMMTRAVDLIDIAAFIGAGITLVFIARESKWLKAPLVAIIVSIALLTTVPIALDSERYIGTRNTIYPFEVEAIEWAVNVRDQFELQTDTHFYYTRYLFDDIDDATLVRRFFGTASFEPNKLMIASERWVSVGVKDLPYGWVKIDAESFARKIDECNLLYSAGPPNTGILVFMSPT